MLVSRQVFWCVASPGGLAFPTPGSHVREPPVMTKTKRLRQERTESRSAEMRTMIIMSRIEAVATLGWSPPHSWFTPPVRDQGTLGLNRAE